MYSYDRRISRELDLKNEGLDGLMTGQATTLYHGTTRSFRRFDLGKSREDLVNRFYGAGIFLTPSKRVAMKYAEANRNIGFEPSIISDLKGKNPHAGDFLQALYDHGVEGWEQFWKDHGFWTETPSPGQGQVDMIAFEKYLGGLDPNDLGDLAGYILGSKTKPLGTDDEGTINIFNQSTGAPDWLYDTLDKVGLDSTVYRPKVYTVVVTVKNTLVTAHKAQAKSARSKGYEAVVYYGSDLVGGVPEVAVFNPAHVRVVHVEVV